MNSGEKFLSDTSQTDSGPVYNSGCQSSSGQIPCNQHGPKIGLIASVSTTFSIIICYGTLVFISLLNHLGVEITVNETLWAGAITATSILAILGLSFNLLRHRNPRPVLLGCAGAIILSFAIYAYYHIALELTGFTLLALAAVWDWRFGQTGALGSFGNRAVTDN